MMIKDEAKRKILAEWDAASRPGQSVTVFVGYLGIEHPELLLFQSEDHYQDIKTWLVASDRLN